MASLSCIVSGVAAAAEMRMSVGWEEEEGEGGVSYPSAGSGFWDVGFWTVLNQHKGDCSGYFFKVIEVQRTTCILNLKLGRL